MIKVFDIEQSCVLPAISESVQHRNLWIDIVNMQEDEKTLIEDLFAISLPSKKEIQHIELSKKLYTKDNALYLTVLFCELELEYYKNHWVVFIFFRNKIFTIRSYNSKIFDKFILELVNKKITVSSIYDVYLNLINEMIENGADYFEIIRHKIDKFNYNIFSKTDVLINNINYQKILMQIGLNTNLIAKIQECLLSFSRANHYLVNQNNSIINSQSSKKNELITITSDIDSLTSYSNSLSSELTFSLNAILGMIAIEQNNIIKFFTVLSIIFLPPTLIASIYGMNFTNMPELTWKFGYLYAIFIMIFSAYVTYKLFKIKKWF